MKRAVEGRLEAGRIGDATACDVEGGAVVGAGADEGQAECDVHALLAIAALVSAPDLVPYGRTSRFSPRKKARPEQRARIAARASSRFLSTYGGGDL